MLGWHVDPERIGRAHIRWLELVQRDYTLIDKIIKAPFEPQWDPVVQWLSDLAADSRSLKTLRATVRIRRIGSSRASTPICAGAV